MAIGRDLLKFPNHGIFQTSPHEYYYYYYYHQLLNQLADAMPTASAALKFNDYRHLVSTYT